MSARYFPKLLAVNLATGQVATQDVERKTAHKFLGGLGLCIKALYNEVGPKVDPFHPENVVVVAPGILNDSLLITLISPTVGAGASLTGTKPAKALLLADAPVSVHA